LAIVAVPLNQNRSVLALIPQYCVMLNVLKLYLLTTKAISCRTSAADSLRH